MDSFNLRLRLFKNAAFIQDQLLFLERTVTKRIEEKEGFVLRDYERRCWF
jgi:uncharacterized protein YllA (UPF0747 family)